MAETIIVELGTKHFQEANAAVRAALAEADTVCIVEAYAQRYLGCTLPADKRLEIHGTPGNDLACYMDGGEVEVFGSAQDQTANTMNAGTVVVHGRVGDAAGYAMRGGELIVRDGCGWRGGINMKQYGGKCPVIVIGGDAGNFLGEYMAGGIIVLIGRAGERLPACTAGSSTCGAPTRRPWYRRAGPRRADRRGHRDPRRTAGPLRRLLRHRAPRTGERA